MRKAILVPSDFAQQSVKPVDDTLIRLHSEMMNTIPNDSIPLDIKMIKYNQILQRYKFLQNERDKPYRLEIEDPSTIYSTITENVFDGIPKRQFPLAKLLTDFISKQQNIKIETNGELNIDGTIIKNSKIIDLVHDLSRNRKTHPAIVGIKPFAKALKHANIPIEYIGNKNRLYYFQQEPQSPVLRQLFENNTQFVTPPSPSIRPPSWME